MLFNHSIYNQTKLDEAMCASVMADLLQQSRKCLWTAQWRMCTCCRRFPATNGQTGVSRASRHEAASPWTSVGVEGILISCSSGRSPEMSSRGCITEGQLQGWTFHQAWSTLLITTSIALRYLPCCDYHLLIITLYYFKFHISICSCGKI